jgi:ketosteroid isomerase-like protein
MSQDNVEIVRRIYEAIAHRDTDAVLALHDPDVTWDATRGTKLGGLVGAGIYHGHKGLADWTRQWNDAWEDSEWSPNELIDAGENVVAGKIVRVVWFQTREEALEAAGLNE